MPGDFQAVEENLRTAMRFFGRATGTGEVREVGGSSAIYSGLDYGVFNMALLAAPVAEVGGLEDRVAHCQHFFEQRTPRWSFWLCEDLLSRTERRRARDVFGSRGMRSISNPPGMLATALRPPEHPLPVIECRPVEDSASREAFAEITSTSFDIPYTIARAVYQPEQAWAGEYRGFVGFIRGRPVAIVAIVAAADVLGVYSLATMPEYRRRGCGEALLRLALERERKRTGLERMALQSTEAGYALYRRMGFRDVTKFSVWLTK